MVAIINQNSMANLARPATMLIIHLLELEPIQSRQGLIFSVIEDLSKLLSNLVERLKATDYVLQAYSLTLINLVIESIKDLGKRSAYIYDLDDLCIRQIIITLAHKKPGKELANEIIHFEDTLVKELDRRSRMPVDANNSAHVDAMNHILSAYRQQMDLPEAGWSNLGCHVSFIYSF